MWLIATYSHFPKSDHNFSWLYSSIQLSIMCHSNSVPSSQPVWVKFISIYILEVQTLQIAYCKAYTIICDKICKRVLFMHLILQLWWGITSFVSMLLRWHFLNKTMTGKYCNQFQSCKSSTSWDTLKFEKLDECTRPLFTNPVTYIAG